MPYTVTITRDEANLLNAAEVPGVEGSIFTFAPSEAMTILGKVADTAETDAPGRSRLSDRLASLYGRHLALVRKRDDTQQRSQAEDFALDGHGVIEALPILSEGVPDNDPQEPVEEQVKTAPRRRRR